MARTGRSHLRRPLILYSALPLLALGLFLLGLAGCRSGSATAPGTIVYEGPQAYTLKPGDSLPGTDIRFAGQTGDGAEFRIGGQRAVKQKADSLSWSGQLADGVDLDLRLRIAWFTQDALYAAGTVKLTVTGVAPQPGAISDNTSLAYQAPVTYSVRKGDMVPGTTLSYEGQGEDGAQFGGIDGYAYRQAGDSLRWEGQLRPGVALRNDLRLVQYDAESARLVGIAHLWVTP